MKIEMNSNAAIDAQPGKQMNLFFMFIVLMSIRALFEGMTKLLLASLISLWPSLDN